MVELENSVAVVRTVVVEVLQSLPFAVAVVVALVAVEVAQIPVVAVEVAQIPVVAVEVAQIPVVGLGSVVGLLVYCREIGSF